MIKNKHRLQVSHSGCAAYRECAYLYYLTRVAGIKPTEHSRAINFGQAGHEILELFERDNYTQEDLDGIYAKHSLSKEDSTLLGCLTVAYLVRWGKSGGKAEGKFVVPIIGSDGEPDKGIEFLGYIDIETPEYVMDHKFTSSNITPTYLKELERNPQAEEYLIAAQEGGSEATYAIWDIIRSKRFPRLLATPEEDRQYYKVNCKGGKKGELKKDMRLVDEPWDAYRVRIVDDIAANPDTYFVRVRLDKTEGELDRRRYDLWGVAKQIEHSIEHSIFPRNEQRCGKFGGCEMAPICWEGVDPEQSELYTIRKR